ncbi:hypothetical protein JK359_16015 [Streptomyces actinomycinicus]|uniref:Transposase n=1 Tax=Streptomyces actinomycinicus TaxID=1695166 RepID=A0A937EJV2_9ACTN|nr:hypothetical protein [Streptomyces actinomycinicus]MBL1083461.1 hypothetical protein [Streptomyces actinomycinicus]
MVLRRVRLLGSGRVVRAPGRTRFAPRKAYGSRANRAWLRKPVSAARARRSETRLATRDDKLATHYEATVLITAINAWL